MLQIKMTPDVHLHVSLKLKHTHLLGFMSILQNAK